MSSKSTGSTGGAANLRPFTKDDPRINRAGRSPLPPEVREALRVDTLPRYQRLMELSRKAEAEGDIKTAAQIETALLRKQIPDLSAVELTGADGAPIAVNARIDATKLTAEELATLRAMVLKSGK